MAGAEEHGAARVWVDEAGDAAVKFDDGEEGPPKATPEQALALLNRQASLLVSVSTGGPRIEVVNARYVADRRLLQGALRRLGLQDPLPYADLWEWYGYWTQHLGTYAQRRGHIAGLARDIREALEARDAGVQVNDPGGPGGSAWSGLETRVSGLADELRSATTVDDLQDVGRRSREILIDLARLLASAKWVPTGTESPKAGDAKSWLDLFLDAKAAGGDQKELRRFIRAAWDLAQVVTHGEIERVDAYAAAQATVLLVRTLQMLDADD